MVFKINWKSGSVTFAEGVNWQDAMDKANIRGQIGWMKSVKRDRSREGVDLVKEVAALRAENAELKRALEIVRNHGRG